MTQNRGWKIWWSRIKSREKVNRRQNLPREKVSNKEVEQAQKELNQRLFRGWHTEVGMSHGWGPWSNSTQQANRSSRAMRTQMPFPPRNDWGEWQGTGPSKESYQLSWYQSRQSEKKEMQTHLTGNLWCTEIPCEACWGEEMVAREVVITTEWQVTSAEETDTDGKAFWKNCEAPSPRHHQKITKKKYKQKNVTYKWMIILWNNLQRKNQVKAQKNILNAPDEAKRAKEHVVFHWNKS